MDLRLVPVNNEIEGVITLDLLTTPMGLDETQELTSAVLVALCTDALAAPDDKLPWDITGDIDRRGWWADLNADKIWGGWPIGSKLWLLKRTNITDAGAREGATIARVQGYIASALQPFIDRKICTQVQVTARQESGSRIFANVVMIRGPKTLIDLQFESVWAELGFN